MIMYVKNDYSGMYDLHLTQIIFICVKKKIVSTFQFFFKYSSHPHSPLPPPPIHVMPSISFAL